MADDENELSKKLQNPVSDLISVPFQENLDVGGGRHRNGVQSTTDIQPVIPLSLSEDWNLIVRTILPVIGRDRYGAATASGLGDITQSFFFTPKQAASGFVWGLGPAFLWPTATDSRLGSGKWGAGPTAIVLKQDGAWTVGALANHIWSYAGPMGRQNVSTTFLQPFVSYNFGRGFSLSLNTESSYDWVHRKWTVPINLGAGQVLKIGSQALSVSVGFQYYAVRPEFAPRWGVRVGLTFLFPTK